MKMAGTPNQVPGERWLSVGSYIDSKDTTGNWCVSKVIKHDLEQGKLVIRYDGWSSKWDMDVHKTSSKIAPFRTYSQLYTGQRKIAIRDWSFSIEELDETEARLRDMLKSDLKCEDAYCTTQFIRGHVFTLIDCLLVNTFKNKAEMHKSVEFFGTVIEFIVEWMKKAKELLPKYYEALTNSELFKSDNDTALACAWPELLFTLKRLFGLDERTCKFFKSNSYATKTYQASDLTYYKTSSSNSLTLLYLINLFAKLGGFECILKLLEEDE